MPAAVGAQINKPHLRPIVFVGDGAFQITGQRTLHSRALWTQPDRVRHEQSGIHHRAAHQGWAIQRRPRMGLQRWPQILGGRGWGCEVRTEGELKVNYEAHGQTKFSIINITHLDPHDHSKALERLGHAWACRSRPSAVVHKFGDVLLAHADFNEKENPCGVRRLACALECEGLPSTPWSTKSHRGSPGCR